jgi:uncharacterized protein (TIGR03086 family)
MIDLRPAARRLAMLLTSLGDDQLDQPTPCPASTVGDLVDHVGALSRAFQAAANKGAGDRTGPPPTPSAANLGPGWRDRVAADLGELAAAWESPTAWEGFTRAGGIEMPAGVAGLVALDELVIHGWDIAVASGQPYEPSPTEVEAVTGFVSSFDAPRDGALFGPVVPVPATASPFDRLLGLTGRDPAWRPPG